MGTNEKPVMLFVESDPEIFRSVGRALNTRYGDRYWVLLCDTSKKALDTLRKFGKKKRPVALVMTAHEIPGYSGVELLEQCSQVAPGAKRLLLLETNSDALIDAIDQAQIDGYLIKPVQPVEVNLYPYLDGLLQDWHSGVQSTFHGIRIVGYRWSPESHTVKNFLSRNLVAYQWLEIEQEPEAERALEAAGLDTRRLPVVFLPDGSHLVQPDIDTLAQKIGLHQQAEQRFYDLVVVGGGPAGLSAAVYGASEGLDTLLIEAEAPGGQAGASARIENYLGFPGGVSGDDLTRRAVAQARKFGVEILTPQEATGISLRGHYRLIHLADGSQVACHAMIIATGVSYVHFNVPGMEKLAGAGIYYGAVITEAMSCQDREVVILGGGNSAGQAAMFLTRFASRITIVTNTPSLADTMSSYLIGQIESTGNIQVRLNATICDVQGEQNLESVTLKDLKSGQQETMPAAALFIYIGARPRTEWAGDFLLRDEYGYILTGPELVNHRAEMPHWNLGREPFFLESSVPGIFVAGDTRSGSVKRIASSVGEGAMAVTLIHQYLLTL